MLLCILVALGALAPRAASAAAPGPRAGAATTSVSLATPAGVGAGDVMLAAVSGLPPDATIDAPSGWTLLRVDRTRTAGRFAQALFSRVAASWEPPATVWRVSKAARLRGVVVAYSGIEITRPVAQTAASAAPASRLRLPSVRTRRANSVVVAFTATAAGVRVGEFLQGAAGPTPARTAAETGFTSSLHGGLAQVVALNSAPAPLDPMPTPSGRHRALAATVSTATTTTSGTAAAAAEYEAIVAIDQPAALWRLADASGTAADATGRHPGTYQGAVSRAEPGPFADSGSVKLDGATGHVAVADADALEPGDTVTIEAWIKRASVGGSDWQLIAHKGWRGYSFGFAADNRLVLAKSGVGLIASANVSLVDTAGWHHVAFTKSGAAVRLYLDGADVTGLVINRVLERNRAPLNVGRNVSGSGAFHGWIAHVAVYAQALTADRIRAHVDARFAAPEPPPPPPDTTPPTAPAGLVATATSSTAVALRWSASSDDTAVAAYHVFRGGTQIATTTGTSYADGNRAAGTTYSYTVRAHDAAGNVSASSNVASVTTPAAPTTTTTSDSEAVIAAAGDIACDPSFAYFNGGLGTASWCHQKHTSDILLGMQQKGELDALLALGDLQYNDTTYSEFMNSYAPSWGRVKSVTYPVPGNHEFHTTNAAAYCQYFGPAARCKDGSAKAGAFYSFNVGSWHIVALNSNCWPGMCEANGAQVAWLKADLAANASKCTLAYWHHPRFSSGHHGNDARFDPFWRALYDDGAEIVLNGHEHIYERFGPQDPAARADSTRGIRQFTVGVGGKSVSGFSTTVRANSEVRSRAAFGVLKLRLRPGSYTWEFVAEAGKTFTETGSGTCH